MTQKRTVTLCLQSRRQKPYQVSGDSHVQVSRPGVGKSIRKLTRHCHVPTRFGFEEIPAPGERWTVTKQKPSLKGNWRQVLAPSKQEDNLLPPQNLRELPWIEHWSPKCSLGASYRVYFRPPQSQDSGNVMKIPVLAWFFELLLTITLNRTFPFSLPYICWAVVCRCPAWDGTDSSLYHSCCRIFLKEYHYAPKVKSSLVRTRTSQGKECPRRAFTWSAFMCIRPCAIT